MAILHDMSHGAAAMSIAKKVEADKVLQKRNCSYIAMWKA
jgi:hypothetical protein